jgi:hypothetical protein
MRAGTSRRRWATPSTDDPAVTSRCHRSARSASRAGRGGRANGGPPPGGPSARAWRAGSIRWPNGTPDGQAVSHPRHCTHVSNEVTNEASAGTPSHWTWRMAATRPRGDSASSPVTR